MEKKEFAELYYCVAIAGDEKVDKTKYKNLILSATGGATNEGLDSFFSLAIRRINNLNYFGAEYFVDGYKFIKEARKDGLVSEVQEQKLNDALQARLEKELMIKPELANSVVLVSLYPNIKTKRDDLFQRELGNLTADPKSSIDSSFRSYNYFSDSGNKAEKSKALMAMQIRVRHAIAASKTISDMNPVFDYIKNIGDKSLNAKIISSLKVMGLKRSEVSGSVKELFPEFYKEYIAEYKSKNHVNAGGKNRTSLTLVEACNGIKEDAKRLICLQEVMSRNSQNVAQEDNSFQDMKKSFVSIRAVVDSGVNFRKYQEIALDPTKALAVLTAVNKDVEPDVLGYLTKSAEAYKDAGILWRTHIYESKDGGVFGRILNYRTIGLNWLVDKYQLPTNVVIFTDNLPLNPSLSIIWRVASENYAKAIDLLDE